LASFSRVGASNHECARWLYTWPNGPSSHGTSPVKHGTAGLPCPSIGLGTTLRERRHAVPCPWAQQHHRPEWWPGRCGQRRPETAAAGEDLRRQLPRATTVCAGSDGERGRCRSGAWRQGRRGRVVGAAVVREEDRSGIAAAREKKEWGLEFQYFFSSNIGRGGDPHLPLK